MIFGRSPRHFAASSALCLLLIISSQREGGVQAGRPHAPIPRYYHHSSSNNNNNNTTTEKRSISLRDRAQAQSESEIERRFFAQRKKGEEESGTTSTGTGNAAAYDGSGAASPAHYYNAQRGRSSVTKGVRNRNIHHQKEAPQDATVRDSKETAKTPSTSNNSHENSTKNNSNRKRRLKGGGAGKKEGTAKLKVDKSKVKGAKKAAAKSSPIDCKERKGKKCKKAGVEKVAGEDRGKKIARDGSEQRNIEPDYSLMDLDSLEQQYDYMFDNVGGVADDSSLRFFALPTTPGDDNNKKTASEGVSMELNSHNSPAPPKDNSDGDTTIPFEPRQIAPRYSGLYHHSDLTTTENRAQDPVSLYTTTTTTIPSNTQQQQQQQATSFRPSGFQSRTSLYTATTGEGDAASDTDERDEDAIAAAFFGYDNEDEQEDDEDSAAVDDTDTKEESGVEAKGNDEDAVEVANDESTTTTTASTTATTTGTEATPTTTSESSFLSFFGSHHSKNGTDKITGSATRPPTPATDTSSQPQEEQASSPTKAPSSSSSSSAAEDALAAGDKIAQEMMEEFTIEEKKDLLGGTYYTAKVAADAVYAEATGSVDLSTRKEDVFASLEPLLSRHLEESFDDNLLQDYQLTITYVSTKDAAKQLRVGTESKVYVTQLVIMVVLHVENTSRDKVASVTKATTSEAVEAFFDPSNQNLATLLRVLNAKGIYTKEIHAQDQPHPSRNHAMDHGISQLTPKNGTVAPMPIRTSSDQGGLFGQGIATTAIVASLATGMLLVLAIVAAKWYNKDRRDRLVRGVNSGLGTARYHGSEAVHSIRDHSSGAIQAIKGRVHNLKARARGSHGYFNFSRNSTASSATSEVSSKLSYIQPAAIQLRRGRGRKGHAPVPQDSPLEGRQDEDEELGPTFDIDLDSDNDMVEIPNEVEDEEEEEDEGEDYDDLVSLPNESDYDSTSSDSSGGGTRNSHQSSLMDRSLDRISIARNSKAVDDRIARVDSEDGYDDNNYTYAAESVHYSPRFPTATRSTPSYNRQASNNIRPNPSFGMTQTSFAPLSSAHAPLSPLSAALEQALADSPKPQRRTANHPPEPPISVRRGMDPPETASFARDEYYYGTQPSPPTSMQDILDEEYINKSRWQDDSEDESVRLPDHNSRFSSSNATDRVSENRLIVLPDEEMTTRPYTYRY